MHRNSNSEVSSSPALINKLRNFRFEKKKSSCSPGQSSSTPLRCLPKNSNCTIVVPENQVQKTGVASENSEKVTQTTNLSNTPVKIVLPKKTPVTLTPISNASSINREKPIGTPTVQQKIFKNCTLLENSSTGAVSTLPKSNKFFPCSKGNKNCHPSNVAQVDTITLKVASQSTTKAISKAQQCPATKASHNNCDANKIVKIGESPLTTETHRRAAMDDYDVFSEKEQSLRKLLKNFPDADIMEAQDLLVSCKWNIDLAMEKAQKNPLRTIARRRSVPFNFVGNTSDVGKGIVYEPETSGIENMLTITDVKGNVTESITEEIILDDSDDSSQMSKPNSSSAQENSVSCMQSNDSSGKKRTLSEDDDVSDACSKKMKKADVNNSKESNCNNDRSDNHSEVNNSWQCRPSSDKKGQIIDMKSSAKRSETPSTNAGISITKSTKLLTESANSKILSRKSVDSASSSPALETSQMSNKTNGKTNVPKKKTSYESDDDEEDFGDQDVYDSDDSDPGEILTPARMAVLSFFQDSTIEELATVPGCSKKKTEIILKYRPFDGWVDLVYKLENEKSLSTDLLNGAKKVIDMRAAVNRIMTKCQKIALEMEDLVESLKECKEKYKDYVTEQPILLNNKMILAPYQMLGLNWLLLMHTQEVNGILADEMGLGKTVQAISLLAYLKEQTIDLPHLIVVPSSTLDNWKKELKLWWPSVSILCYHGAQDHRRELRLRILNGEVDEFDVMLTTYNMVSNNAEDKGFFKRLDFYFVIFDEAHMLKNMSSQRYQNLMRIHAQRRLLLTGTPLQNNLVELMSLLIFVMPDMFSNKTEHIKQMFSSVCKSDEGKSKFEKERIEHAKRIMKPFVLRRLKNEVLQDLPAKRDEIIFCPMTEFQKKQYVNLVATLSEEVKNKKDASSSGAGMMMQLRKAANHPLLLRNYYDDLKLKAMTDLLTRESSHREANPELVLEDMQVMSDFELHQLCKLHICISSFQLTNEVILDSGKFRYLESILPELFQQGDRLLLFSQFTMVLDIVEEFMKIKRYKYLRLDGSVPVADRQILIDQFNDDSSIPIFLLSTKAGGLGINLTAANVVLLHDIDFNPYNDKQAEDRCHRVGQKRSVRVVRMISKETIEEGMLERAKEKLKLEKDITSDADTEEEESRGVATLLKDALGLASEKR